MRRQTTIFTSVDQVKGRQWRIVDAEGVALGRLAAEVAQVAEPSGLSVLLVLVSLIVLSLGGGARATTIKPEQH